MADLQSIARDAACEAFADYVEDRVGSDAHRDVFYAYVDDAIEAALKALREAGALAEDAESFRAPLASELKEKQP